MPTTLQPIPLTASVSLTRQAHSETTLLLQAAAGLTVTLPASDGSGATFKFYVDTTVTSNNDIIQVANSTDVMQGNCVMAQDAGDTAVIFETTSTSDTITMNGSTKAGIRGDVIELTDVKAGFWQVKMVCSGTGTEATPFSAAV